MHSRIICSIVAILALLSVTPAHAQTAIDGPDNKQVRDGFWLEIDLGYSSFGCDGCGSRSNELATDVSTGAAVGDKWLIGLKTTQSIHNIGGDFDERILGVVGLGAHFYPTPASGFHIGGSAGVAYLTRGSGDPRFGNIGGTLGVGYDTPRTGSFGFTPYAGVLLGSIEGDSFNTFQVGVGVSWH